MGLRNFLNRRNRPVEAGPPHASAAATASEPPLAPGQLADLDAARVELLQLAAEVGVKSLSACPRDGSRWQDDPATIRSITALLREARLEERDRPAEGTAKVVGG